MIICFLCWLSSVYVINIVVLVFVEIFISEYGVGVLFCILYDVI